MLINKLILIFFLKKYDANKYPLKKTSDTFLIITDLKNKKSAFVSPTCPVPNWKVWSFVYCTVSNFCFKLGFINLQLFVYKVLIKPVAENYGIWFHHWPKKNSIISGTNNKIACWNNDVYIYICIHIYTYTRF